MARKRRPSPRPSPGPDLLLAWYDRHRRVLPWRAPAGARPDPYHVWLSEIMLQQTTVVTVGPYFMAFLERWPRLADLAAAPLEDVMTAWAGLGYYSRARNLHASARLVMDRHGGIFPSDAAALGSLPGIGAYTAAAIAAIAFDQPIVPVDGNVERVTARLFEVTTPLPVAKPELTRLAQTLLPPARSGDFAQALMDLGATLCTPRRPRCLLCPWSGACAAHRNDSAESLPARLPRAEKPVRRGIAFWAVNPFGAVLLRRRPPRGLLGGMMEFPSTDWLEAPLPELAAARAAAPVQAGWRLLPGLVRHTFTHFRLELAVAAARTGTVWREAEGRWVMPDRLGDEALPSLMRKLAEHALAGITAGA